MGSRFDGRQDRPPHTIRCPICRSQFDPQQTEAMPFCSRRCQQLDLGRWLNQEYSLPAEPAEDDGLDES